MLVGVNDDKCLGCGRARPGLFGLTALLRQSGLDDLFVPIVMWGCGAAYLASLAMDPSAVRGGGGLFSLLAPGIESLFVLGASGSVPVFRFGRWWTILSASWLHGGILHIVLNMISVRNLGPAVSEFYGGARTVIIYFVAGAAGFLASSFAGAYLTFLPARLHGGSFTVGASAGIFGLLGAVLHYGRRGGQRPHPGDRHPLDPHGSDRRFALPVIDNWAHLGGLAGGYLASFWLDPFQPERGTHSLVAVICLLVSLLAIVASVLTGLPLVNQG
jgi:rhomboid protease GluP